MQKFTLDLIHSLFEHLLHSYNLHLVSTYKYEVGNCLFNFISYLLNNQLSSSSGTKSYGIFKSMLLLNTKKNPTMSH